LNESIPTRGEVIYDVLRSESRKKGEIKMVLSVVLH